MSTIRELQHPEQLRAQIDAYRAHPVDFHQLAGDLYLASDLARDLARDLNRSLARDLARDLNHSLALANARDLNRSLARDLARARTRSLARANAAAHGPHHALAIAANALARDLEGDLDTDLDTDLDRDLDRDLDLAQRLADRFRSGPMQSKEEEFFDWVAAIIYGYVVLWAAQPSEDSPVEGVDLVLVVTLDEMRRSHARPAVETIIGDLQRLFDTTAAGDDQAACGRWRDALIALMGLPDNDAAVEALNGAMLGAERLLRRLEPPDVDTITNQLEAAGADADVAREVAETIVEFEQAIGEPAGSNDGSEWNRPVELASKIGAALPAREPAWDDLRGKAKKAQIDGISKLIEDTFHHPVKAATGLVLTLTTAWAYLTEVLPRAGAMLRWALAALRQRLAG